MAAVEMGEVDEVNSREGAVKGEYHFLSKRTSMLT